MLFIASESLLVDMCPSFKMPIVKDWEGSCIFFWQPAAGLTSTNEPLVLLSIFGGPMPQ